MLGHFMKNILNENKFMNRLEEELNRKRELNNG